MTTSSIPSRPCTYPGCHNFAKHGRCDLHISQVKKKYDANRELNEEWRDWIHSRRYRTAAAIFKANNPLCVRCEAKEIITPVYLIHHKIPHEGDWNLFWDKENWESLCNSCHEEEHSSNRFGRKK